MDWEDIKTKLIPIGIDLQNQQDVKRLQSLKENGYLAEDGEPIKCPHCQSNDLREEVTDTLDNRIVLEKDMRCNNCESLLGSWVHGYWEEM